MATREYWLQIENHPWDVMPNGIDRVTGQMLTRDAGGRFRPLRSEALIVRRYSSNWASADDRPVNPWDLNEPDPSQTQGTLPGATVEAKVGDELLIHFRNMDMRAGLSEAERTHSLHAHGVQRLALYDGTYPLSPPDSSQGGKQGDRVAPGDNFDYRYSCPHASNAGTWFYHDHSVSHHASVALGAFGTIIVRAAGEQSPDLPTQPLRGAADTPTRFATVPRPPGRGEHVLFFHELDGIGECLNGRVKLGNTPSVLARSNSRVTIRCINLTSREQSFHIHGHRWLAGSRWVDTQTLGPAMTLTLELLEDSAENGGGRGEWPMMSHTSHVTNGSLLVTEGGGLILPTGMTSEMPETGGGGHHH